MYLGIDLGTSNSAIVGNDHGALRLFKTPEHSDVLPSAILIDRRGHMFTGKRAHEQTAYSPENVIQGFKRLMGTSTPLSVSGRSMTPEEASAEIIKALIAQAKMTMGDFEPEGTIVTIPAAFNQLQCEATMRAAAAAGLSKVALLQEPVAAAMASVASANNKSGQFLVYDLGGGTFDVAIVQSVAGSVTVVAHAGINMCGGRDIDRAIVNSMVRPWLLSNFKLPPDFQQDERYARIVRIAQYRAEIAKIALSTQLTDRIFADENQINAKDLNGEEIYLDIEITREGIEALIIDQVDRTIEHCRGVLKENGYRAEDIDRIVLIGGPTRMPLVRSRVSEQLGVPVDLETDPMAAVAQGAAIYAEGRQWGEASSIQKPSRGAVKSAKVKVDYPARTADDKVRIRVSVEAEDDAGFQIQIESDQGWSSGLVSLKETVTVSDVPVLRRGDNHFKATTFDARGIPLADGVSKFVIVRAAASSAGIPATHTIAVKVAEGALGSERNALQSIVQKGTLLPATGVERFRAARDMRASDGSHLDFELYQQSDGVTEPNLNLFIGSFRISSNDLEKGDVIRKGDEVFVHWAMDDNGLLSCSLEVPKISQRYDTGKMYVDRDALRNFEGEAGKKFASEALERAGNDLRQLEGALGPSISPDLAPLYLRLSEQQRALDLAYDADTLRSISNEALAIRQEISRIKHRPENLGAVTRSDLDQFLNLYGETLAQSTDEKVNAQIHRLARHAADALAVGSSKSVADAKISLEQMRDIFRAQLFSDPSFWVGLFEDKAEQRHLAIDTSLHDQLCARGSACITAKDIEGLQGTVREMFDNLPRQSDAQIDSLSGLMRA